MGQQAYVGQAEERVVLRYGFGVVYIKDRPPTLIGHVLAPIEQSAVVHKHSPRRIYK